MDLSDFAVPLGLVVGAVFVGFLFELVVLRKLREMAASTRFRGDDLIVGAVKGVTTLWFGIAGVYLALVRLPLTPAVAGLLRDLLLASLILSGVIVLARIAARLVGFYTGRIQGMPSSSLLTNLARITVLVLGGLVILQSLGIAIGPLIAALGVGGLAVALAMQETLSNLFSGVMIIASRQLRPGDFVRLDSGEEGYVEDVNWRNTTIRSLPNNMIIVPNARLAQSVVTNYYQPERKMSVVIPVGVSYESDLSHVEEVTIAVANEVMTEIEGGVPEFEPFIRYNNFGSYSIDFSVIMQTREVVEQYRIKHEFIKRLHRRYGEEGIVIPYPIMTNIHVGEGIPTRR
ncbi:mechanosensitive ion channel protein [Rubrobacter xylanophilus]|uniref:Mechanosensitive ion channel protein n=1 Tax=Rubrobacter xylanophilus TaxID=49319 RepID=A0A510HHC6_9ACTN|nr:mechanosensitive ion channel family protein [Rubrobacter xylanophilus]BBL78665.1 mechanosensitive ion channel protein [Rubrobacter xylanophilus]